jgi:hypothetical protein
MRLRAHAVKGAAGRSPNPVGHVTSEMDTMRLRTMMAATLILLLPAARAAAQDAAAVVASASKAMGVDTLSSITYSGAAKNGAFGQSKAIAEPMGPVNVTTITQYTRTLRFDAPGEPTALVSRATAPTRPPAIPGVAAQPAGVFNQNVTAAQAGSTWAQALHLWTTPWGFVKGAAAGSAQVRRQGNQLVVSFSPATLKSPSGLRDAVLGVDGR